MVTESSDAIASKRPDRGWKRTCIEAPCKQNHPLKLAESHSFSQIGIQPRMTVPQWHTVLSKTGNSGQKERLLQDSGIRFLSKIQLLSERTTSVGNTTLIRNTASVKIMDFVRKTTFVKELGKMPIVRCLLRAQNQKVGHPEQLIRMKGQGDKMAIFTPNLSFFVGAED
jgi:hypothetical protein